MKFLHLLRRSVCGAEKQKDKSMSEPAIKIETYANTAALFRRNRRWVYIAKKKGWLVPARLPGGKRSVGITVASMNALQRKMAGG